MNLDFTIKSNLNALQETTDTILESCQILGYDREFTGDVKLILEEIIVNIIKHGYDNSPEKPIQLTVEMEAGQWMMTVQDEGKPFNPLDYDNLNKGKSLDEMTIGGQGIHLVKQIADRIDYKRTFDKNQLKVILKPAIPE